MQRSTSSKGGYCHEACKYRFLRRSSHITNACLYGIVVLFFCVNMRRSEARIQSARLISGDSVYNRETVVTEMDLGVRTDLQEMFDMQEVQYEIQSWCMHERPFFYLKLNERFLEVFTLMKIVNSYHLHSKRSVRYLMIRRIPSIRDLIKARELLRGRQAVFLRHFWQIRSVHYVIDLLNWNFIPGTNMWHKHGTIQAPRLGKHAAKRFSQTLHNINPRIIII